MRLERHLLRRLSLPGLCTTLAPLSWAAWTGQGPAAPDGAAWLALGSGLAWLLTAFLSARLRLSPTALRLSMALAMGSTLLMLWSGVWQHPIASLLLLVGSLLILTISFHPHIRSERKPGQGEERARQRALLAQCAWLASCTLSAWIPLAGPAQGLMALSALWWLLAWSWRSNSAWLCAAALGLLGAVMAHLWWNIPLALLALLALFLVLLGSSHARQDWSLVFEHPARVLAITFAVLALGGSLLLQVPGLAHPQLTPLQAVFTAVSAVCVTGLTVVDTATQFTPWGQAAVLLLIQLGGLGIMGLATLCLHALGHRLSLRQERMLSHLTASDQAAVMPALWLIVRYTLACELLGGGLLYVLGWGEGTWSARSWDCVFTAVSAFCNAGFALHSDSLISAAQRPGILYTVSLLIIAGGMAPACALAFPRWLCGRRVPVAHALALSTSALLTLGAASALAAFEWSGALAHLPWLDRLHNAWFQAVTLRTAGFNSIDQAALSAPGQLLSHLCMFIGGSPGGTAGGTKTTTCAILALAVWGGMRGHSVITVGGRSLTPALMLRALAIIGIGLCVWLGLAFTLLLTQAIPVGPLLFELTSALGTVGLSMNTTSHLDEVGQVVIIIAMFLGRVGPLTVLVLLARPERLQRLEYPPIDIPLS